MASYEFVVGVDEVAALDGGHPVRQHVEQHGPIYVEMEYPMGKAPVVGATVELGLTINFDEQSQGEGELYRVPCRRVFSIPNITVRGQTLVPWRHGQTLATEINGKRVNFQFCDHPHTDPRYQTQLEATMRASGIQGLGNVRYSQKLGRHVVDVVSNVEDPLGKLEAAKKRGDYGETRVAVNQPYQVRGKKARGKKGAA